MIALKKIATCQQLVRYIMLLLVGGMIASCQAQSNQSNEANQASLQQSAVSGQKSTMQSLSPADFQSTLLAAEDPQLLDVRSANETAVELIPGAMVLDVLQPGFAEKAKAQLDPSRPVWVYCRSGNRSKRAAGILAELGISTIYELDGGITAWKSADYPTKGQHTAR